MGSLLEKIGADKLERWAGQWERVNEQLGIMGQRFTAIAREASMTPDHGWAIADEASKLLMMSHRIDLSYCVAQ